jgi:hypothetical protein
MPLSVVKEDGGVLITHAEKSHSSVDVGVVAAHDVTSRHIDDVLALVGKEASDLISLETEGRPAGEEDPILNVSRQPGVRR